jgi:hypothetical protein
MAVTDAAVSKFKYGDEHKRKPGCPRRGDMPVHGLTTSKNFITANAIENILAGPWLSEPARPPAPRQLRTRCCAVRSVVYVTAPLALILTPATRLMVGAEPPKLGSYGSDQYLYRKDYGAVPQYLRQMKARHSQRLQAMRNEEIDRIRLQQDSTKLLSPEDRAALVRQLKAKWDAVNNDYQKSSTLDLAKLDTMGKVSNSLHLGSCSHHAPPETVCVLSQPQPSSDSRGARWPPWCRVAVFTQVKRKENYEAELQQLESYIDRLSAKRHVFVTA